MKILLFFLSILVVTFSQPTSGPCFQSTRLTTESMNCTDKGYFELIQCFEKYCVCVDPLTGHEADGTKTFSNRILPTCGPCFIKVAKDISTNGINDRLPICDSGNGKYFGKQCHGSRCTCVDSETGEVKKRGGFELTCEHEEQTKIDFSIDSPITGKKIEQIPLASPTCGLSKDRGHACPNGQSKVMVSFLSLKRNKLS
uniref:Thyroglobulin type-1 domain-containing protein n=1 Tax=Panagrolaimus sp. PS1159 TaxID=55785 RepID=A0AC35FU48_9BILA